MIRDEDYYVLTLVAIAKELQREKLTEWFWDMFIVNALIGNWDRHNGNWGFLYNTAFGHKDQWAKDL